MRSLPERDSLNEHDANRDGLASCFDDCARQQREENLFGGAEQENEQRMDNKRGMVLRWLALHIQPAHS
jgi:hypothetical protein